MKRILHIIFAGHLLAVQSSCAQVRHPAQISFKVVDETGSPVRKCLVRASTPSHWKPGEGFGSVVYDHYETNVDQAGTAVLTGQSRNGDFGYIAFPEGMYYSGGSGGYKFKHASNGRWEPWNPEIEIVVARILNPIPLYARKVGFAQLMKFSGAEPVGFDLMESDWVAPHGKGTHPDFVFSHEIILAATHVDAPHESAFTLTFANEGDGIQAKPAARPLVQLPRHAPEAGYENKLHRRVAWGGKGTLRTTYVKEDQNYFFRVRTVLDPNGKVISALYGKIYGDIVFDVNVPTNNAIVQFAYYLNPTPLDRNLEFDPKRNLLPYTLDGTSVSQP